MKVGFLRLILVNLRNILILLALIYLAVPLVGSANRLSDKFFGSEKNDRRAALPSYQGANWAARNSYEFGQLEMDYYSFIGWRRKPYSGETITIDPVERIRITPPLEGPTASSKVVYFFGGSTMWGKGANDEGTIPAFFQKYARLKSVNYGEGAWTAHQSLNQLIKLYIAGARPNVVVFYDGVNEVHQQCRTEHTFYSAAYEPQIREMLNLKEDHWAYYLRPLMFAANEVADLFGLVDKNAKKHQYNCDESPEKAKLIARQLVVDWQIAQQLVKSYGGEFYAFLQPVAYESKTKLDHIAHDLDDVLGAQYAVLYPMLRSEISSADIGTDITNAFDRDEYIYIDYCHVAPRGNEIIGEIIAKRIMEGDSPTGVAQETSGN